MKNLAICAALLVCAMGALMIPRAASATCTTQTTFNFGHMVQFTGSCTDDNEVLITTGDLGSNDSCQLMSSTGAVDVFLSLNGSVYATAPYSLQDFGATDVAPVLVTAALRIYGFRHKARSIRILQNGATDAAVVLNCWKG